MGDAAYLLPAEEPCLPPGTRAAPKRSDLIEEDGESEQGSRAAAERTA